MEHTAEGVRDTHVPFALPAPALPAWVRPVPHRPFSLPLPLHYRKRGGGGAPPPASPSAGGGVLGAGR
jgi:hypothetical protein